MGKALAIYHSLPPFARQLAASAHGWQLRQWRYGPETNALAAEAQRREKWTAAQWHEWQQAKLSGVLERARKSVPYYRQQWQERLGGDGCQSHELLQNWPILSKEKVRRQPRAFVAEDVSESRLRMEQTSGTTGTPLRLWHSRETARAWYALMETRWRGWYGVSRQDCWAILGGQLVTPASQKKPPFWVWNAGLKELYLSSYHLSPETCASYFQAMKERNIFYLWGYASSLFSLALFASEQHLEPPHFNVVVSNAEPLYTHQRDLISRVFGCPVRDTYGMSEMVAAAGECEHGRLHLWPEAGIVEVFADDRDEPAPWGTVGRLICTGLINQDMPLIRYELGDRGALASPTESCPCGRTLPILQSIEGRDDDVIITADHRRIGRLDSVFKADFPIREAQVIQETLTSLRVKVVPDERYTYSSGERIKAALRERVGQMPIVIECVDHIPRGQNGKFWAVISQVRGAANGTNGSRRGGLGAARPKGPLSLRVFHKLPPFARSWAASVHGYSLKASRYSSDTLRLTEEALARDHWPAAAWRKWLDERLLGVLRRAALQVPFYQRFWEERRRGGDDASFDVLANWPILKKEALRTHPELFVASDCDRRKMHAEHTSGTTGTPLTLWRSRQTSQHWYALNEARIRRWNGLTHQSKWGHVGGQPVVPFEQRRPPYWVWNSALNQLYLSCMHIGPQSSPAYLAAIKQYGLDYLLGYSSSIALLARSATETGVKIPLKLVVTDSEPLLDNQRSMIENAFACPVRETYGMAEITCAASECSAGSLHIWPEAGFIELLDENDQPVGPGQTGRIIATQLINPDMPLIRYDTQDMAQAAPDDTPCACGRPLPRLQKLLGRDDDVIITQDGRRIVQVDRIFDPCFDMREAQIVQEEIGRFRIKVVPGARWSAASGEALCQALGNLVGEAEIGVDVVPEIERTWAGKYRVIVSKVSAARS
jgi:phenylacetate-CoA ligase